MINDGVTSHTSIPLANSNVRRMTAQIPRIDAHPRGKPQLSAVVMGSELKCVRGRSLMWSGSEVLMLVVNSCN